MKPNMRNLIPLALALTLTSLQLSGQKKFEPVNKNASPEARALLDYLYSISGKKIISGHHNGGDRDMDRWHKYVEDLTGKSPALWGSDFGNYYREGRLYRYLDVAYRQAPG
jgi:mannan endo-1,4-beta-mannosidase